MRFVARALLLVTLTTHVYAKPIYIGILDEPQNQTGTSSKVLFVKKEGKWLSFADRYYREYNTSVPNLQLMKWIVAFNGQKLGELKIEDPDPKKKFINSWFYARDKFFSVSAGQKTPQIKNVSKKFGGWVKVPNNRPLVLVSEPNFNDPEHWKPFAVDDTMKKRLYVPLKLVIGKLNAYRCPDGPYVNEPEPYSFTSDDIVIYSAYTSSIGQKIVSAGLNDKKFGCDGLLPPEWSNNWFLLEGENVEYIGREMTLVDAGDYDGDGQSELLFWHNSYNEDGYILIYNAFQNKSEYLWGYH
ncbi:hypothetical protein LOH54_02800 [Sulfurimonas sp. HSL-3221]|uniref:hypothetical protein n=1 Tax=Sulfurimonadaceae TaxID=2771471 RepID=UPI001E5FAFB3|nr:hypothetical protein [Sulfurimonas sp. HSL-3221]UFS63063.1 hypothetical protein LOH54_02800 [Sulfurimonas sp. HSL-3221]